MPRSCGRGLPLDRGERDGGLGDLAGGCFFSYAYAVSADGALVAGGGTNALAPTAATWTAAGGWTDLGFAAIDGNSSVIIAVTADGTVAVGNHRIDASPSYQAFRWSSAGGLELLGDLEGGALFASALDVADDGATIVGFGTSAAGVEAFRWTEAGGMTGLGDLEGGAFESRALALAPDASIVVGTGTTDAGLEAAVWEGALPIARLADLLAARGVVVPEGFVLSEAVAITIVGRTVVVAGNGTSPDGDPEGWVARFCAE
ncbi:MAG: hypothetical protein M5U28_48330 [Sandaracinaceae bacterium]|nr:hypothetical protein [Sandaracinaceae bacterium]